MDMDEYQEKSLQTVITGSNALHFALGLCSEAGEAASIIMKADRDNGGCLTLVNRVKLKGELGDILWQVSAICSKYDFSLGDVATTNRFKLSDRKKRGVLRGSGDDR